MRPDLVASDVLVLIPAFNEQASIGEVIQRVRAQGFDTLVIDDGSTDLTSRLAKDAGAIVVELPLNLGVGGALRTGFRFAVDHGYPAVVQCDADGQHPPEQIGDLIEAASKGDFDLLIGSRFRSDETRMNVSPIRRSAMKVLALQASISARTKVTDPTSGFRVIRSPLLESFARSFPVHYLGDTHEALVSAGRAKYRIGECAVAMDERQSGLSTASTLGATSMAVRSSIVAASMLNFSIPRRPEQKGSGREAD